MTRAFRISALRAGAICLSAASVPAFAQQQLELNAPFSDHAVIQRGKPVFIRGRAKPATQLTVSFAGLTRTVHSDANGDWHADFPPQVAAEGQSIVARSGDQIANATDIAIGDVLLCSGQSNMEFPLSQAAWNPPNKARPIDAKLHLLTVAQAQSRLSRSTFAAEPKWQSASESAASFSAVCFLTGREIATRQNINVGLINASWGGTPIEAWLAPKGIAAVSSMKPEAEMLERFQRDPVAAETKFGAGLDALWNRSWEGGGRLGYANLYNAMIAPLHDYGLAGVVWYQGESNARHSDTTASYRAKLAALLSTWREQFRGEVPFVIIQIAGFGRLATGPDDEPAAQVREAQREVAVSDHAAGLVVTTDISERLDIHPPLKLPVAQRAALVLRRLLYHENLSTGPEFGSAYHDGTTVVVRVIGSSGKLLSASWGRPGPFILCALDSCRYADASLEGTTIRVLAGDGPTPDTIRFCYSAAPICNVFDEAGMPLGPFSASIH